MCCVYPAGVFELDVVNASVVVRNRDTNITLWTSSTSASADHARQQPRTCCLALDATGNLALTCTSTGDNTTTRLVPTAYICACF